MQCKYNVNVIPSVVSILSYFGAVILHIVIAGLTDMHWCFLFLAVIID